MPIPRVAIVGRPNVGKSSLLNMLAAERIAIVDPTPGVTRDRVAITVDLEGPGGAGPRRAMELIDTGGYGVYTAEGARFDEAGHDLAELTGDIEGQIAAAVEEADIILFAIDTQAGVTAQDEHIATLLRRQAFAESDRARTVVVVATKCDGPKWENHAYEFTALGFDELLMCSAKNNYLRREFSERLYAMLPEGAEDAEPERRADLQVAIVGKRNAGKSTLINTLAGEERVIASEIPGTTRDAIDVRFELDGRSILAIDTAGLRRKKSFASRVEWFALDRAERAIKRADVVLFLIDSTDKLSQVDEQLGALIMKSSKPVLLVMNKWDLAEGQPTAKGTPVTPAHFEEYLRKELRGLWFAPMAFVSAKEGVNLGPMMDVAFDLHEQASQRVSTGKLNRLVRSMVETRGPSSRLGSHVKVYFAAQVRTNPPTIVLVVNHPDLFDDQYKRYMLNRFREQLPFEEVPIRLVIRGRSTRDKDGKKKLHSTADVIDTHGMSDEDIELLRELPDDPGAYFDDE